MKLNSLLKFVKEVLFGAFELIIANVESKIGFAIMFLVIGLVFLIPREGEEKYFFSILGIASLVNSIRLFTLGFKEIKNR